MYQEEVKDINNTPLFELNDGESTSISIEEDLPKKRRNQLKSRSVSFAPTVKEYEIPSRYDSSFISLHQPIDYIDALVESYKLQTLTSLFPYREEKPYVSKTTYTRLNPNWREHRIRRLMNKLEELSLWDREEELKFAQAQFLREQKLEQIQDRQRNHNLCLNLMRQRHESEMESAVLLDRITSGINDENRSIAIARAMNLTSPNSLSRHVRQDQEKIPIFKTPIGRYRQFETNMNNKLERINQKIQPDWKIMHTYNSYRTLIPTTVSPLFSETYATLLAIPNTYSSLHQSLARTSSPNYEINLRAHSNRDVRVPLKEEINEKQKNNNEDVNNDDTYLQFNSNSLKRSMVDFESNTKSTLRDHSLIHSRQPTSNSIHQRTLNDDLNAITQLSFESSKNILQNNMDLSNGISTNKRVTFLDDENNNYNNNEENYSYLKSSRMISLSST